MAHRLALAVLIFLVVVMPVRAHRCQTGAKACWDRCRRITGAIEMYRLDHDLADCPATIDGTLADVLVRGGYLQASNGGPLVDPAAPERKDTYRILDGEVYCILHGFARPADPKATPREQLVARGVTDPARLEEAGTEVLRVECWCVAWMKRHRAIDGVWALVVLAALALVALFVDVAARGRSPFFGCTAERGEAVFSGVVKLFGAASGAALLMQLPFGFHPSFYLSKLGLLVPGLPVWAALLLSGALGLILGVGFSRRLHRRLAGRADRFRDMLVFVPDVAVFAFALAGSFKATTIPGIACFGQVVRSEVSTVWILVLVTLVARFATATVLLKERRPWAGKGKPAPDGLRGMRAHPSRSPVVTPS